MRRSVKPTGNAAILGKITFTGNRLYPLREKRQGGSMVTVSYESGEIQEIGSGFIYGKMHYHSHLLLKRDDGQVVRLEDVAVDDYIDAAVKVGRPCTVAFINRKLRLPKPFDHQVIRNAIVGVAASDGYVAMNARAKNYYPHLSFGIAGLGALLIIITRDSYHPTAWFVLGALMVILFGLVGLANVNTVKNTNGLRDEIIRRFESLGSKPQASVVYG